MKILCLGNNTEDSDLRSRALARDRGVPYHGLISDLDGNTQDITQDGVYHSTPVDCSYHRLLTLCDVCDQVVVLDQSHDTMHADCWMQIWRLCQDTKTPTLTSPVIDRIRYWSDLLDTNHSLCALPWVESLRGDADDPQAVRLCCRSDQRIDQPVAKDVSWQHDPRYVTIRQKMLAGERLPHCESCYRQERLGLTSDRRTETLKWVNRLALTTATDLESITEPAYLEIRSSNRCNLMCRMCNPTSSHRIAKEYHQLGWIQKPQVTETLDLFADIDPSTAKKIYVSGGEPMLDINFLAWLDREHTQPVELVVNTNGTRLPLRLRRHLAKWPNMQFIFSIDGYHDHNQYIRWPSVWEDIEKNWQSLRELGHRVHVNTTVSIYNVHRLSPLFAYIDRTWPDTLLHINLVQDPAYLDFRAFPDRTTAQADLELAAQSQCVKNNRLVAETVDHLWRHVGTTTTPDLLQRFFEFNDQLDASRNTHLSLYDTILHSYRK